MYKLIKSFLAQKYKINVNKSDNIKTLKTEFVGERILEILLKSDFNYIKMEKIWK